MWVKYGALLQVASEILELLLDESDEVVEVGYCEQYWLMLDSYVTKTYADSWN